VISVGSWEELGSCHVGQGTDTRGSVRLWESTTPEAILKIGNRCCKRSAAAPDPYQQYHQE